MQGSGSRQPQVPRDQGSPRDGCASWNHLTVNPPGTKFLAQVFLEGMSGKWRSATALPVTKLSLEEFPASPGHGQAPDVQKLGTLLQNELNTKGDPRNSNPQSQLCIRLSSSVSLTTPMGESNSPAPIFHYHAPPSKTLCPRCQCHQQPKALVLLQGFGTRVSHGKVNCHLPSLPGTPLGCPALS